MGVCYSSLNGLRQLQMFLACWLFSICPSPSFRHSVSFSLPAGLSQREDYCRTPGGGRGHSEVYPPCHSFLGQSQLCQSVPPPEVQLSVGSMQLLYNSCLFWPRSHNSTVLQHPLVFSKEFLHASVRLGHLSVILLPARAQPGPSQVRTIISYTIKLKWSFTQHLHEYRDQYCLRYNTDTDTKTKKILLLEAQKILILTYINEMWVD